MKRRIRKIKKSWNDIIDDISGRYATAQQAPFGAENATNMSTKKEPIRQSSAPSYSDVMDCVASLFEIAAASSIDDLVLQNRMAGIASYGEAVGPDKMSQKPTKIEECSIMSDASVRAEIKSNKFHTDLYIVMNAKYRPRRADFKDNLIAEDRWSSGGRILRGEGVNLYVFCNGSGLSGGIKKQTEFEFLMSKEYKEDICMIDTSVDVMAKEKVSIARVTITKFKMLRACKGALQLEECKDNLTDENILSAASLGRGGSRRRCYKLLSYKQENENYHVLPIEAVNVDAGVINLVQDKAEEEVKRRRPKPVGAPS